MFENPRRGRQARNFCNKCSENSRSQIVFRTHIFRKLTFGAPDVRHLLFTIFVRKTACQKKQISRWPFHLCTVFEASNKFPTIFYDNFVSFLLPRLGFFSIKKGNLKFSDSKLWRRVREESKNIYWSPWNFDKTQVPLGWPHIYPLLVL